MGWSRSPATSRIYDFACFSMVLYASVRHVAALERIVRAQDVLPALYAYFAPRRSRPEAEQYFVPKRAAE